MGAYIRFLFGTPRRTFTTLGVVAALIVFFSPGLLKAIVERLIAELNPLVGPLLGILIVIGAFKMILGKKGK